MNKENDLELLTYHANNKFHNPINMGIWADDETKLLVVAFSGTQRPEQAVSELLDLWPVPFTIEGEIVDGVEVEGYFLHHF